jgi:uncharacterized protein (TIGR02118 family)
MIKAITYLKRRPGMPVADFQTYWREQHPAVVKKLPGLRRDVQSHTRPGAYEKGEPAYDGIAEVWFDGTQALRAAMQSPEFRKEQTDDANFIAPGPVPFLVTTGHRIVG